MNRKKTTGGGSLKAGFGGSFGGGSSGAAGGDLAGSYPNPTIPSKGKVLVDSDDTTLGYLGAKIISDPGITVTSYGPGNEHVGIAAATDGITIDANGGVGSDLEVKDLGITDAKVAAANKDGMAGTPSMRTLGTGENQAAPGNIIAVVDNALDEAAAFVNGSIIVIRSDLI